MKQIRVVPVLVFALAVVLAGCSQGDDDSGVDSLDTASPSSTSNGPGATSADREAAAQKWRECMLDLGVDIAVLDDEPVPGEPPPEETAEDKLSPAETKALQKARDTCDKKIPQPELADAEKEADREASLAMAQCMRDEGFDVPDPVFNSDGSSMQQIPDEGPDAIDVNDPAYLETEKKCFEKHASENQLD